MANIIIVTGNDGEARWAKQGVEETGHTPRILITIAEVLVNLARLRPVIIFVQSGIRDLKDLYGENLDYKVLILKNKSTLITRIRDNVT